MSFRPLWQALRWRLHRAHRRALARVHPLRYLYLEVTRRCDLCCAYCGSDCSRKAAGVELQTEEWIRVVRQIAVDFDPPRVMIAVTGGEPLLKEGVLDLFAELRRLRFPFGCVSNGQRLDGEMARQLVARGIGSISLSLDAPEPVNDALRGRGAFAKVLAAVGHLRSAGFEGKLEIMSTLTRPAVSRLAETRELVASLRISRWRLVPAMPIGRAVGKLDLVPNAGDLRTILDFIVAARRDGLSPRPELCEEGFLGDEYEYEVRPYLSQCMAGITMAGILCDGRIGACPELSDAFVQGDIRTERFREVWEHRYQLLRDRAWTHKGDCAACAEYGRCQGGSLHLYPGPEAEMLRCFYLMTRDHHAEPIR